jgi:hypothetical protein
MTQYKVKSICRSHLTLFVLNHNDDDDGNGGVAKSRIDFVSEVAISNGVALNRFKVPTH